MKERKYFPSSWTAGCSWARALHPSDSLLQMTAIQQAFHKYLTNSGKPGFVHMRRRGKKGIQNFKETKICPYFNGRKRNAIPQVIFFPNTFGELSDF